MSVRLAVLADDLTGATDAAYFFERAGFRTTVWLDERVPGATDDDVAFVDLETRRVPAELARRTVADTLSALGSEVAVALKIDSTLRGNIAAELEALLAARPAAVALVVPAHPRAGRTQQGGALLLHGAPVHASEFGRDLHAPVASSAVADALPAGSAVVGAASALGGEAALRAALAATVADGARAIACDATVPEDLAALVAAVGDGAVGSPLWVGSAGLFEMLAPTLASPGRHAGAAPAAGPTLFIVGSLTSMTRAQIARFADAGGACELVEPRDLLIDEHGRRAEPIGRRAAAELAAGRDVLLGLPSDRAAVEAALAMGRAHGFDPLATSRELRERLVELARPAVAAAGRIVLSGGDVARSFCEAFGITGLALDGEAAPGIPSTRAIGGAPVRIVPKGGGAGDAETYLAVAAAR